MKVEVKIPEVGESISEATIGQWLKEDGDYVEADEVICEVESEKATVEIAAEQAGKLEILVEADETVEVGSVIAKIDADAAEEESESVLKKEQKEKQKKKESKEKEGKEPEAETEQKETESEKEVKTDQKKKLTPLAAKISEQEGIDLEGITGTGPEGRITKEDVLKRSQKTEKAADKKSAEKTETTKSAEPPKEKEQKAGEKRKRMSTFRQTIARRLLEAKHETAMLTTMNEVDLSKVKAIRAQYKDLFAEKHDVKLGFMSFFARACSVALKEFPLVNARIDGQDIVFHDHVDISIAVSTPKGLVVPVVRNIDKMSLAEIERTILDLAQRARDNKLSIDEMSGGTFSITNGGVFGSLISTPIINHPQSAILGMHTIQDRPVVRDGQIVIRPMMYVALSYDHRLIDGKESVSFLVRVKELLEDPTRILLDV